MHFVVTRLRHSPTGGLHGAGAAGNCGCPYNLSSGAREVLAAWDSPQFLMLTWGSPPGLPLPVPGYVPCARTAPGSHAAAQCPQGPLCLCLSLAHRHARLPVLSHSDVFEQPSSMISQDSWKACCSNPLTVYHFGY